MGKILDADKGVVCLVQLGPFDELLNELGASAKPQGVYRAPSRATNAPCQKSRVPSDTAGHHRVAYHENFEFWMKVPETVG